MMMIMLDLPALMLTLSFPFYRLSRSDDFSCQISFDDSFLCVRGPGSYAGSLPAMAVCVAWQSLSNFERFRSFAAVCGLAQIA